MTKDNQLVKTAGQRRPSESQGAALEQKILYKKQIWMAKDKKELHTVQRHWPQVSKFISNRGRG